METAKHLQVALVSTERGWGGGEEQARLLALGLRSRGHNCVVFARDDGLFARRMTDEGLEVVRFRGKGRSLASLWKIRQHLRRIRPDVLHCNDSHALTSAGLAALGPRIPARIASRRVVFPPRSALHYRWFADRVVCVSEAVAEICRKRGIPADLLQVVHDGVDPSRANGGDRLRGRKVLDVGDDQTLVLTVAKLTDCKGHTYLLNAAPAVLREHPEVIFAFAGDGELLEPLQEETRRLGIESRVRFLGFRQDVPDLLHAADLFVLPSHTEGLCSTLIDAMLAGRSIVTTTAGGIPELTGACDRDAPHVAWSVPPRDCDALARAILDALDSPEKRAEFQERARSRAEKLFTANRMVESTLEVYRQVLRPDVHGGTASRATGL